MTDRDRRISEEAVTNATGNAWNHWFDVLDDAGGTAIDHKQRVAALADAGVGNPWWQQQIAVEYERERGLRELGETAEAGYEVGVQRTIHVPQEQLWADLTAGEGLATWLGDPDAFEPEPGRAYETTAGVTGEVRTVAPGERLRLTWQPPTRETATTLQITLTCPRNDASRTTLRIHHEGLADGDEREAMRERWTEILETLRSRLEADPQA